MSLRSLILMVITFMANHVVNAQQATLSIVPLDEEASGALSNYQKRFSNPADAIAYLQKLVPQMQEQGRLAASIDSVQISDTHIVAFVYTGKIYNWVRLSPGNVPVGLMTQLGINIREWQNHPLSPGKLAMLTDRILSYYESNGYPFATVNLDSIHLSDGGISASLQLNRGSEVRIDSIKIEGDIEIDPGFLYNYLDLFPDQLYNETALRKIHKKIADLAYLKESAPWQMEFGAHNVLRLFLEEKKANQINGLIGIQPNTFETGKLMLTADVLLALKNALGYGEAISLTYQQLQYRSPRFQLNANWPYVFGTKIGVDGDFELFKRDTVFYRTIFNAGARYLFNATDYARIFYNQNSNRVSSPDLNYITTHRALPPDIDVSSRGVGVEYFYSGTDYRVNPRKGLEGKVSVIGLLRDIRKNDAVTSLSDGTGFDYSTLYDTVQTSGYQYKAQAQLAYYLPITKSIVFRAGYQGGWLNGGRLFQNELFQIGGFKILRGFDEQSIYTNQFHVASIELRLLLGSHSYFYIFNDNALVYTQYADVQKRDFPIGIGTGISLETKTGIFSVAFAVGKHEAAPFQFRQTKIHFGYVAYF